MGPYLKGEYSAALVISIEPVTYEVLGMTFELPSEINLTVTQKPKNAISPSAADDAVGRCRLTLGQPRVESALLSPG